MAATEEPLGVLPVDKPAGPTSHDAVAVARRALGTRRIGHTGTLDPFASGLLLLCIGRATRLAEYLVGMPKTYEAVLKLGEQTDTDDRTGVVRASSERWRELTARQVAAALERLTGPQWQVPPGYSAKKVGGERLYEKARRGEVLAPSAARVEVMSIRLISWDPPFAGFETTCSSGTYVRALARDAGADLQVYGHLAELRRTAIGSHRVEDAVPLQRLQQREVQLRLLSVMEALPHLPQVAVDDAGAAAIRNGRPVPVPGDLRGNAVLVICGDRLLAVGSAAEGWLRPRKVFHD